MNCWANWLQWKCRRQNACTPWRCSATVFLIDDYLRSRLTRSGFPKGENEKKIFGLACSIERQFTIGYWSVARELTCREVSWLQAKPTVLAIQRTIKGLSRIVVTHYMMSYPIPDWIWIDLHSLYKLAVKLGKADVKVADQGGIFSKQSSIEDSYKQILLLSLAYPSGLMQKEFQLVYEFIEKSPICWRSKPSRSPVKPCSARF